MCPKPCTHLRSFGDKIHHDIIPLPLEYLRKLEGRLTLIRRNLLGSTKRRSDVTSVFKEATLPDFILDGANRYGARATGAAPGIKLICNSTGRAEGRPGKSSGNTLGKSRTIGKVPYLVALVALLGARVIVVKMALGALMQGSPIRLLFACPHIVDLGDILPSLRVVVW
ncbi:hypothetical protein Tco_0265963 [Tanacetum coccineum]